MKSNTAGTNESKRSAPKWPEPARGAHVSIPEHVSHLNPFEFPSSARLEGLFRRKGITRLGQLNGVPLEELRKFGNCGPRTISELAAQMRAMAAACVEKVCPLTPQLLSKWLQAAKSPGRYPLPVYVRLLGELHPDLPAWPAGQEYRTDPRPGQQEVAMRALRQILQQGEWRLPLKAAYKRTTAQAELRGLSVVDFVVGLKHARGLAVEFPKPDQPQVRLRWMAATKAVASILEASRRPLTLKEIIVRLKSVFGPEMGDWSLGSVRRALTLEGYCLARGSFGLRHHFRLSVPLGRKACADVYALLQKQNAPISPFRVVSSRQFKWTANTNGYELAEVLREEGRFVEVRRFHFDLASRVAAK